MIQAKRTLLLLASGIFMCMFSIAQNNPAAKADTTKKAPPTPPKPTVAEKVKTSKKNRWSVHPLPGYCQWQCATVCKEKSIR